MPFVERVRILFHEILRLRFDDFGEPENETSTKLKNAQYIHVAPKLTAATSKSSKVNIERGNRTKRGADTKNGGLQPQK